MKNIRGVARPKGSFTENGNNVGRKQQEHNESKKEATQCAACGAHHKAERAFLSSIYLLLSFGRNSYPATSLRPRAFLHVWLVGREGRRR